MEAKESLVCVYASSSMRLAQKYYDTARELGRHMVRAGYGLCFGGGKLGLMGALADEILSLGGRAVGVIPASLNVENVVHEACHEMIVTKTLRERKQIMEERAMGFIALPGGFGTLEEVLEIITLKQLAYHTKPIVLLNAFGYYDPLLAQFEQAYAQGFAGEDARALYSVAQTPEEAVRYLQEYKDQDVYYDKISAQMQRKESAVDRR